LRALRWIDVDFSKRLVHVRRAYTHGGIGPPKSGRVRSVPLIDDVAARSTGSAAASTSPRGRPRVPEPGRKPDRRLKLRRRFYKALERAGLKRLRFHDLRHSFGTLAVQVFPLTDVKAYMGHADIQTTMVYVHHVRRTTRRSGCRRP